MPNSLKFAKVVPVFKKGNANDLTNYRPIAILPLFAKILEKIIHERLYTFLQVNNVLTDAQFGFRKKISTALAVSNLCTYIQNELEKNNFCIGLFMDLSKAFDTIDHHILLKKLNSCGVRGLALSWFEDYLTQRSQYNNYTCLYSA